LAELARMNLIQKSRGRGCVINKSHQLKKIGMFHLWQKVVDTRLDASA
jgi:DNA-binding GntR family transcriptional regulator